MKNNLIGILSLALFATLTHTAAEAKLPNPPTGASNNDSTTVQNSPLLSIIQSAQKTIDIEIYQMENALFIQSLRDALSRHVKIRIIKEPAPLGDKCKLFKTLTPAEEALLDPSCLDQMKLKKEIMAAGGTFIPFNKLELCADSSKPCYLHGKLVIADQKIALISTGNFNDTNLCDLTATTPPERCNRDFSIVTKDSDVLSTLNEIVERDVKGIHYEVKDVVTAHHVEEKLTISPDSLQPLVEIINRAKTSITLQNQYLNEPTLNEAISRALSRGVKLNIMVSSICAFGPPTPKKIEDTKTIYGGFESAGANVKMFTSRMTINGKQGYLHAKVFIIDNTFAWVGSVNGSSAATSNNREFGLMTSNASDLKLLNTIINGDFANPNAESWLESTQCKKDDPLANVLAP